MAAVYPATQSFFELGSGSAVSSAVGFPSKLSLHASGQLDFAVDPTFNPEFPGYDSSPSGSYSSGDETENTLSPVDDEYGDQVPASTTIKPSGVTLASEVNPFNFADSPFEFQPDEVVMDPVMQPHNTHPTIPLVPAEVPQIADFSFNLRTPAGMKITMARSAIHRLSQNNQDNDVVRRALEFAARRYHCDPKNIAPQPRPRSQPLPRGQQSSKTSALLESLVDLEKDSRGLPTYSFSTHGARLRELVASMGGPLNIESSRASRMVVHLESIYGTVDDSYVWNQADFMHGLAEINSFFSNVWTAWQSFATRFSLVADEMKSILGHLSTQPFTVRDGSVLKNVLLRPAEGPYGVNVTDRVELICQLTSLITLCSTVLEQHEQPIQLQQHMDYLHEHVESLPLSGTLGAEQIMWFIQSSDASDLHSRRIWAAAKYVWILKHVTYNVQCVVKDWLLKFLTGQPLDRCFKLDAFYFSYAS